MPRLLDGMDSANYRNLRALLQWDREKAKETILRLKEDSKQAIIDIEDEMIRLHGYKWKASASAASLQFINETQGLDRFSCCS